MTTRQPRQARARRTRERLLAAGCAEFSRIGYARTTASSIAEAAQVATGSFYQYFENKDELLEEVAMQRLQQHAERLRAWLVPLPPDVEPAREIRRRVEALVGEVWTHHSDDPAFHAIVTERRHADSGFDERCSAVEAEIVAAVSEFLTRHSERCTAWGADSAHTQSTAAVLFAMVEGAIHAHVLGARPGDPDALRTAIVEAVLRVAW